MMTYKEILKEARRAKVIVDGKHERILQLRDIAEGTTRALGGIPSGGQDPQRMAKTIETIVDFEQELAAETAQMAAAQRKAREIICTLPQKDWQCVLELYYLNGYLWRDVAQALNYSLESIYKKREQAMAWLKNSAE